MTELKLYSFSVVDFNGEEQLMQYKSYSREQALYFLSLDNYSEDDIVDEYSYFVASR